VDLFTIGAAGTSAESFFSRLRDAGVARVIDIRLANTSQLAGFTKAQDLPFFLAEITGAAYVHEPRLAPTQELFDHLKKRKGDYKVYERGFLSLLDERGATEILDRADLEAHPSALLCACATPDRCHRRLVASYLADAWGGVRVVHL
jgi:uncharacterized protein (DUF488 family)